jgi:hypothetical protein
MCGAVNTFSDALNEEGQLQQAPPNEDAHEERHDSRDQRDDSVGGRILEAQDHVRYDADAAGKNANNVKNPYDAAHELPLEREVNETRNEVLFLRHVASWQDLDEEPGNDLGTAFPRDKSRRFAGWSPGTS